MKSKQLLASLFSAVVVTGCGGGGGDSTPTIPAEATAPAPATPTPTPATGGVSARLAAGVPARVLLNSIGYQSASDLATFTQELEGGITAVNDIKLTGAKVVRDVSGDETFAMGRWAAGSVEGLQTTTTLLSESSNNSFHYVLIARASSFPTSGSLTCTDGKFTAPNWNGNGNANPAGYLGVSTGVATLSFSSQGAAVSVTVNTQVGAASSSRVFSATIVEPSSVASVGPIGLNTFPNASIVVGRAAADAYAVGGWYAIDLSGGGRYHGAFRFVCK